MSLIAYVGLPGSGKSYDVVANQIMPGLKAGRRVVTNIPLNRDAIRQITPKGEIVELPLDQIMTEPHRIDEYATPGCLLVIDECWRLWPTGQKADKVPQPFKSLLAEHRHRVDREGRVMQIVLVTQDLAQLAAFARQLVELTFHHTKLAHVGMRGSYRIDVFHGAVAGAVPPVQNRLRESFGTYRPAIFRLYKSHTMSESAKSGADERPLDARGNALRRPAAIAGILLVFVMGIWGAFRLHAILFGGEYVGGMSEATPTTDSNREQVVASGSPVITQPITNRAPPRPEPPPPQYRLVGYVERVVDGTGYALVLEGREGPWRISLEDCLQMNGRRECIYRGWLVSERGVEERVTWR